MPEGTALPPMAGGTEGTAFLPVPEGTALPLVPREDAGDRGDAILGGTT